MARRLATHRCSICGWHGMYLVWEGDSIPAPLLTAAREEFEQHVDEHGIDLVFEIDEFLREAS